MRLTLGLSSFRCYCKDCLNLLVGPGTFDKLKEVDPWSCYICLPSKKYGVLKLRPDWSVRLQNFFANNSALEFVSMKKGPNWSICFVLYFVQLLGLMQMLVCVPVTNLMFFCHLGATQSLPLDPSTTETTHQGVVSFWWHCYRSVWAYMCMFVCIKQSQLISDGN